VLCHHSDRNYIKFIRFINSISALRLDLAQGVILELGVACLATAALCERIFQQNVEMPGVLLAPLAVYFARNSIAYLQQQGLGKVQRSLLPVCLLVQRNLFVDECVCACVRARARVCVCLRGS